MVGIGHGSFHQVRQDVTAGNGPCDDGLHHRRHDHPVAYSKSWFFPLTSSSRRTKKAYDGSSRSGVYTCL